MKSCRVLLYESYLSSLWLCIKYESVRRAYLLTEGYVNVAILVNLCAELSNFITSLLNLLVYCVPDVAVILFTADKRFLWRNQQLVVNLPFG